jgi:hypothetical protein
MSAQINKYSPFQPSNVTDLLSTLVLYCTSCIRWDTADIPDVSEVGYTSSSCDYHTDRFTSGSRDSSVGIAIMQRAGRPRNRVSIPGRCKRFYIPSAQTGIRANLSLIKWVPGVPPPKGKAAAASRLPLTTTPHIIKRRDNFFQWLFQPIQGPGLLLSSAIVSHRR